MSSMEIWFIIVILILVLFIFLSVFVFIGTSNSNNIKEGEATIEINVVDYRVSVPLYLSTNHPTPFDVIVDWGDETVENSTILAGTTEISHKYNSNKSYTIKISNGINLNGIGNISEDGATDQINKITSVNIIKLKNLIAVFFYDTSLKSLDLSGLSNIRYLGCVKANLSTEAVNNILITVNNFNTNASVGGEPASVVLQNQVPPAPPSGAGITAKEALISRNWNVMTD